MILQSLGLFFILIMIIIITIDLVPIIGTWVSRIQIGKYGDIFSWNNTITKRGVKWLSKTPKIKITDNTRLVVIEMLKGNYSKSSIQHWQEGSLLLGLSEYLKNGQSSETKKAILKFLDGKFDSKGQWINKPEYVDVAILAYAVMKLDFIETDKYKKAFDYIWQLIKDHVGEDGTVMYRKSMKNYRYVDTIGFICPFLITYGVKYGIEECIELAVKQIKEYEKYGMHNEFYLPSHAYDIENKMPLGLYGWGRGLGWLAIGLIDAWNELPENHKYKLELDKSIKKFAHTIMNFQRSNGSWNWTVTRNESRHDSSTTAALSWFLLNAAKIDDISQRCLDSSKKALHYLMMVTRRSGAVDFSQGDTKDIGVYSSMFTILPFTQGFSMRSINLYLKYLNSDKKVKNVS